MLNEGIPFTVPATESSCSSSHSTKRGSRAAQRRHVAMKKEGGLLAEEGERERSTSPLYLVSPHLAIREHIAGEGEGALSGVGRG